MNKLKICFLNVYSLRNKFDEINLLVKTDNSIDFIILNEIWLYSNESDYIKIGGYHAVFNCRNENRGGGTAILVKHGIKFNAIDIDRKYNATVVQLDLNSEKNIKMMTAYRASNEDFEDYVNMLDTVLVKHKKLVFLADTNINLLKDTSSTNVCTDMLFANGYKTINSITNETATRKTESSGSLIDLVISNFDNRINMVFSQQYVHIQTTRSSC